MRPLIRLSGALFFFCTLLFSSPVQAHTELVSATPAAGTSLSEFPADVTLIFNEKLLIVGNENPNKIEVFDESGSLLSGSSVVTGATITVPSGINGNGNFTVKYHVAAQDGHVVEGSYSFSVQSGIAIASPMPISSTSEMPEDGPNLLVRGVGTAILGGVALILLRRARS